MRSITHDYIYDRVIVPALDCNQILAITLIDIFAGDLGVFNPVRSIPDLIPLSDTPQPHGCGWPIHNHSNPYIFAPLDSLILLAHHEVNGVSNEFRINLYKTHFLLLFDSHSPAALPAQVRWGGAAREGVEWLDKAGLFLDADNAIGGETRSSRIHLFGRQILPSLLLLDFWHIYRYHLGCLRRDVQRKHAVHTFSTHIFGGNL